MDDEDLLLLAAVRTVSSGGTHFTIEPDGTIRQWKPKPDEVVPQGTYEARLFLVNEDRSKRTARRSP